MGKLVISLLFYSLSIYVAITSRITRIHFRFCHTDLCFIVVLELQLYLFTCCLFVGKYFCLMHVKSVYNYKYYIQYSQRVLLYERMNECKLAI